MKDLVYQVKFSAPYWHEVAPKEQIFRVIKSKLRSIEGISIVDFEKEEGIKKKFWWLNTISKYLLIKKWIDEIKEAERMINNRLASSS